MGRGGYNLYQHFGGSSHMFGGGPRDRGGLNIPGLPGVANQFLNMGLSAFGVDTGAYFNQQSPMERMIGLTYQEEMKKATGMTQNPAQIIQNFKKMDTSAQQSWLGDSKNAGMLYMAAGMTGMPAIQDAVSLLPGVSETAMSSGIMTGMSQMAGGSRWMSSGLGSAAAEYSEKMAGMQLNLMPREAGQMFSEMGKRGMTPGRISDFRSGNTGNVDRAMKQWDKTLDHLKDVFGEDIPKLFKRLDKITQGSMQTMSSQKIGALSRKLKQLQATTGMSDADVGVLAEQGSAAAQSMGLHGMVGAELMVESALQASQLTKSISVGGAKDELTGLSSNQRADVDMRRRMLEQKSRAGIMSGGLLSLVSEVAKGKGRSGKFGDMAASLGSMGADKRLIGIVKRLENNDPTVMKEIAGLGADELAKMGKSIGIGGSEMYDRLTTESPYQQAMTRELQSGLRGASTDEVIGSIATKISGSISGVDEKVIKGALLGLQDIKSLDTASATAHIKSYLSKSGVGGSAKEQEDLAGQILRQTKLDSSTRLAGLGGFDQIFREKQARARRNKTTAAFAEMDAFDAEIKKVLGGRAVATKAIDMLFSTDQDPGEVFKNLTDSGKKVFKELRPMMHTLAGLQSGRLKPTGGKTRAEAIAGLREKISSGIKGLSEEDIAAISQSTEVSKDGTPRTESMQIADAVIKIEKADIQAAKDASDGDGVGSGGRAPQTTESTKTELDGDDGSMRSQSEEKTSGG